MEAELLEGCPPISSTISAHGKQCPPARTGSEKHPALLKYHPRAAPACGRHTMRAISGSGIVSAVVGSSPHTNTSHMEVVEFTTSEVIAVAMPSYAIHFHVSE